MAGLKEIRIRIASVNSTKQITSAMKMVSASKLRKAQMQILKLRPFSAKFNEIFGNLKFEIWESEDLKIWRERELNKILIIPIVSNRGMCGSFNSNIIKGTLKTISDLKIEAGSSKLDAGKSNIQPPTSNIQLPEIYLACIGKKAYDYFSKRKYNVVENFSTVFESLTYDNIEKIAETLINWYLTREYDRIIIVYNQFRNAAFQELKSEQFLPISVISHQSSVISNKITENRELKTENYIFEPGKIEILSELVPRFLKLQFYKDILESNASEHGARMTAMHIATENATEILKQLRLSYNKARQASITKELLEIVSGAEALKSN